MIIKYHKKNHAILQRFCLFLSAKVILFAVSRTLVFSY